MSSDAPERHAAATKVEAVADLIRAGLTRKKAIAEVFGDGRNFWHAIKGRPDLEFMILQAQGDACDLLVDQALEIADDKTLDPAAARNMIDIRKWTASKRSPQRYGDRLEVTGTQTISVTSALDAALSAGRARLAELEPRPIIDAEVIQPTPELSPAPAEWPDIFS